MQRLFFDIETSPNIGLFWEPGYGLTLTHENIVKERAIICICWKWAGKSVKAATWDKNQDDRTLLETFLPILKEADEVVTQNGERFDIKWVRTRALYHGLDMPPDIVSQDTYKLAKYQFKFNANRLDYMGRFLGEGGKIKTDYDMWRDVLLNDDRKALGKMVRYCKRDVELLERIWNRMKPYVKAKSHVGHGVCPECGSRSVTVSKRRQTAAGYKKVQTQCQECGKYNTMAESRWNKLSA